jgi:hypothetical protein
MNSTLSRKRVSTEPEAIHDVGDDQPSPSDVHGRLPRWTVTADAVVPSSDLIPDTSSRQP